MSYPPYLTIDCETTGATNDTFGNPFTDSNRLCYIGYGDSRGASNISLLNERIPYGESLRKLHGEFRSNSILSVGFNWKFDAHWLRRYGINLLPNANVWDTQLAEFIIRDQQIPLPSLEDTVNYYKLGEKYISIEHEYWNKGIDTDKIPPEIVAKRVESDVILTSKLFELQCDILRKEPSKKKLIWVSCQDQKVLEEMEWNGLKYNISLSIQEGNRLREEQKKIEEKLNEICSLKGVNWASKEHLSAILYGGVFKYKYKETYIKMYKDGSSAEKERWVYVEQELPRLITPFKNTEYAKGNYWSTDDKYLSKYRPKENKTKKIIALVQKWRKIDKIVGTYYHGLPKLYEEMGWTKSLLHGQLNSAVTRTGRLSSNKPNQQNMDEKIRKCIISRFGEM